jgi:hypothetical protein
MLSRSQDSAEPATMTLPETRHHQKWDFFPSFTDLPARRWERNGRICTPLSSPDRDSIALSKQTDTCQTTFNVLSADKAYVRSGVVQKETSAAISALGLALLEAALAHQGRLLVTQYLERTIMSK